MSKNLTADLVRSLSRLKSPTAETMAKASYAVLCRHAKAEGQTPSIEVSLKRPGERRHYDDTTCWAVVWEAGPYQWAIPASMAITVAMQKVVEPYYSFDLCFYPTEDLRPSAFGQASQD